MPIWGASLCVRKTKFLNRHWELSPLTRALGADALLFCHRCRYCCGYIILVKLLLCFVISRYCVSCRIPVVYFFTIGLTGVQLHKLMPFILKKVEVCGLHITGLVTSNHKVNVYAMKLLGCGCLTYSIKHPCDPAWPSLLSFDPRHVLKNGHSQFKAYMMFTS